MSIACSVVVGTDHGVDELRQLFSGDVGLALRDERGRHLRGDLLAVHRAHARHGHGRLR